MRWLAAVVALVFLALLILELDRSSEENGGGWILNDLPAAMTVAEEQKKPVLINFWTPSCYWCVKMDREVMQDPAVKEAMSRYVLLRVDTSRRGSEELVRRYGIYGTPGFVVLSPEGEVLAVSVGYMPKEKFLTFLRGSLP